jgi:hypothetical protein
MEYAYVEASWRRVQFSARGCTEVSATEERKREYISTIFTALGKLVSTEEYDEMLGQWRLGLREIWIDNGFVMTCLTLDYRPTPCCRSSDTVRS